MQRRHWGELRGRLMQQGRRITQMIKMSMMILILMLMTVMTIDMDVAIRCQMTTNKKCVHHLAFIFCALRSVAAQPNAWAVGISSHLHWHEGPDRAMIGTGRLEHAEYPEAAIASAMDYNFAWRTSCTKYTHLVHSGESCPGKISRLIFWVLAFLRLKSWCLTFLAGIYSLRRIKLAGTNFLMPKVSRKAFLPL